MENKVNPNLVSLIFHATATGKSADGDKTAVEMEKLFLPHIPEFPEVFREPLS
jgi:hypothetical protein